MIFDIQRFCINDGPGIRTTVFFKGCPLDCLWCHNPESKKAHQELSYDAQKCVNCGRCVTLCKNGCHSVSNNIHSLDRRNCTACGRCVNDYCEALKIIGKIQSPQSVIKEVLRDRRIFEESGGGLTLSGGEPLNQVKLCCDILSMAKENQIHTCIETCGYTDFKNLKQVSQYSDLFLYDYKITDAMMHEKYTGCTNELIIKNLFALDSLGAKVILRCPIIPGINDNDKHFSSIAEIAQKLRNIVEINIEPYHTLGQRKCIHIGGDCEAQNIRTPQTAEIDGWIAEISAHTSVRTILA